MNKLKKVGLTALATTLVASSAYAADMSVSGSASIGYSGLNNTDQTNPWYMGDSVVFSAGGDLDNGMSVSVSYELDTGGTAYDDYSLSLNLGDGLGTLGFSGGSVSPGGVDSVKDIVPNAYTPVYEAANEAGGAADNGLATTSGRSQTSMFGYTNTIAGVDISVGFNPVNSTSTANLNPGAETSVGLTYATPIEGLTVVAGWMDDSNIAKNSTYGAKFSYGPLVAAYQITEVDYETAQGSADQDAEHMGISYAVNENLTVALGQQEVDITGSTLNETNTGFGVSYTMGSISIAAQRNKLENGSGTAANDVTANMLSISFAF
jgi:outer membrane protein OmpU